MDRRASLSNVCDRCIGFVKTASRSTLGCSCSEAQLDQFLAEIYQDQQLVRRMLFFRRRSEDEKQPMDERVKATTELQILYSTHEQLAIRNGIPSPYSSG
jgi:hypothetical protein